MAGSRFGRNIPIEHTFPDPNPLEPSPREVSRVLLTRHELVPATSVNALVAAWLQWMIRDWFSHGRSPTDNPWRIPLADDDPWPGRPMLIMRTRPDPTRPPGPSDLPPTYANTETPWWDGSQIYGTTPEQQRFVRDFPETFTPEIGAWGRQGCTRVKLAAADEETLGAAMTLAWQEMIRTRKARQTKTRAGRSKRKRS